MSRKTNVERNTEEKQSPGLREARIIEGLPDDDVFDSIKHSSDVVGIGGTGNVRVNNFVVVVILALELMFQKFGASLISVLPVIIGKTYCQWYLDDFFGEEVAFIEEENHGRIVEPPRITYFLEQIQSFHHPICVFVLVQNLVIFGYGCNEQNCSDIFKAMYPFLSLIALSTNVEHFEFVAIDFEFIFHNTRCTHTRSQ